MDGLCNIRYGYGWVGHAHEGFRAIIYKTTAEVLVGNRNTSYVSL